MSRLLLAACLALVVTTTAFANTTPGDAALGPNYRPSFRLYDGAQTPGVQRLLSRRLPFAREAERATGVEWWVLWNERTRRPRLALAAGAPIAVGRVDDDARLTELARDVIARHGAAFGADNAQLREFRIRRRGDLRLVQFRQFAGELLATPTFFNVVFFQREDELVLTRMGGEVFFDLADEWAPSVGFETAESIARDEIDPRRFQSIEGGTLEIAPRRTRDGKGLEPCLNYRFRVEAIDPIGHYEVRVDAETGEVIVAQDLISYIDFEGNVSGWATPGLLADSSANPETLQPLEGVLVSAAGIGSTFTDASGDFVLPYSGTTPATLTFELRTPWVNVNNDAGPDAIISQTVTPGVPVDVVFNPTQTQTVTAQVNGCRHTHRVHEYIKEIDPTFSGLDFPMACNVNLSDTCNAFYTAGTINFFSSGGGCTNTAFSTVVYHEYGHAIVDEIFPFFVAGNFNEGISDVCATMLVGDPRLGAGMYGTTGSYIRNVDAQDRTYPADVGGPIHDAGLIVGGSFWDTYQALLGSMSSAAALEICRDLYLFHMDFLTGQIAPALTIDVMTIDDDDGNLLNGTPNYAAINAGFGAHGLPGPDLQYFEFTHTPLSDTEIDYLPYAVTVEVDALIASGVDTVDLVYSAGGPFTTVPLSASGNTYSGEIPITPSPEQVRYYIRATDSLGNIGYLPETAPGAPFSFFVGLVDEIYSQPIGPTDQGWVHAEVSGQDDWQRGAPNQQGDNDWDPLSAFSPPFVWGNDLNPPGWNGDYRNNVENTLETPSIDCSGKVGVQLQFRRWLTVEKSQYDQARIRVNGNQVFINPFSTDLVDTEWVDQSIDISAFADDNPDVRIQWSLETDGGLVFGGWNIDDIRVLSIQESNPSIFTMTTESAVGPAGGNVDTFVHLRNDEPLRDYTVAVSFDETQLTCTEVTLDGTDAGLLDPDFFLANIQNDSGIYSASVTIDLVQVETLPIAPDQSICRAVFEIPASVPQTTVIPLSPGVALGNPPVGCRVVTESLATLVPGLVGGSVTVLGTAGSPFIRGDANGDGVTDISDAVAVLGYLFVPGFPALPCLDAADVDDNGQLEVTDPVYLIEYLLVGGSAPPPPFPAAGPDPTADGIDCGGMP